MGATVSATTYVAILESREDGTVWLQVQLPGGRLVRGPYWALEDANEAASALEGVARRRWAGHEPEAGPARAPIGDPAPMPPVTAGGPEESAAEPPNRPDISRFPRILARFRPTST